MHGIVDKAEEVQELPDGERGGSTLVFLEAGNVLIVDILLEGNLVQETDDAVVMVDSDWAEAS